MKWVWFATSSDLFVEAVEGTVMPEVDVVDACTQVSGDFAGITLIKIGLEQDLAVVGVAQAGDGCVQISPLLVLEHDEERIEGMLIDEFREPGLILLLQ